jgi:catechol 2,3-dioxygenase-like lactoylglutathione lyase family enzyme
MNSKRLAMTENKKFPIRGVNHIALVCKDMKRTVAFYEGILGMPLFKTTVIEGLGQHFFFDMGGSSLAFFWFRDGRHVEPGVTVPAALMGTSGVPSDIKTAIGTMNHIAFDVEASMLAEYKARLESAGVKVSPIVWHNDIHNLEIEHSSNWCTSIYFKDPDGIQLEFAGWTRAFGKDDVVHEPATAP